MLQRKVQGFPKPTGIASPHCTPEEGVLREMQRSWVKQQRYFSDKKKKGEMGIPGRGWNVCKSMEAQDSSLLRSRHEVRKPTVSQKERNVSSAVNELEDVRPEALGIQRGTWEENKPLIVIPGPGWCDPVVRASSLTPKGCQFNSQSGHIPGSWVWSRAGSMQEATD